MLKMKVMIRKFIIILDSLVHYCSNECGQEIGSSIIIMLISFKFMLCFRAIHCAQLLLYYAQNLCIN